MLLASSYAIVAIQKLRLATGQLQSKSCKEVF